MTVLWSDHGRIAPDVSAVFEKNFREISESHFAWQAQYSVMSEDDTCCFLHCT